ncbi:hypothetical protein T439DRAFT_343434 [Meredithblackwellia eburnea MCA 4105]
MKAWATVLGGAASFVLLGAPSIVHAQEGPGPSGATSNPQAAGYSCDPKTCVLPACNCASVNPPGGLAPNSVPQFITFTADDAIQSYTIEAVNHFLAQRKNPNGCPPKMTYFTSLSYTNYSLVTDWYVAGNEIADHTMTHILGNLKALNAFSGIPVSSIKGFRAPLLSYNADTLTQLHADGFVYDSSATSASPANQTDTDAYWPYTLDNGFVNDCLTVTDVCKGQLKLPGLWEIPMYAIFDQRGATGIHLMDPWLDSTNTDDVLNWLKDSFLSHYNGNRQPFGLYTHPIHLAVNYPGLADPIAMRDMINTFLDWTQTFSDVWIVSNEQMLEWIKAPVPNSQIASTAALGCSTPNVDASLKICNGIPQNEAGLLVNCPFADFPWTTCYGCPVSPPTPDNPVPQQNTAAGVRYHLPANCSTAFFDPVKNQCTCQAAACAFTDNTGPITTPNSSSSTNSSSNSTSPASGGNTKGGAASLSSITAVVLSLVLGATTVIFLH